MIRVSCLTWSCLKRILETGSCHSDIPPHLSRDIYSKPRKVDRSTTTWESSRSLQRFWAKVCLLPSCHGEEKAVNNLPALTVYD